MNIQRSVWLWAPGLLFAGCLMSRLEKVDALDAPGDSGADNGGASSRGGKGNTSGGSTDVPEGGVPGTAGTAGPGGGNEADAGKGGTSAAGESGTDGGGAGGTNQGGAPIGEAGAGGSMPEPKPCSDPVGCIDEVANKPSSFGNAGWKDSWWVFGCIVKSQHDCINVEANCNSNDGAGIEDKGIRSIESFPISGEKGQRYKVTFRFSGVVGARVITGGKRDSATATYDVAGLNDTFYRDGAPQQSNYDVMKLTVFDDDGLAVRHYYMNSGADSSWEGHRTYLASYTKSIVVVGQGRVEHLIQDPNCHAIDNCNPGEVVGTTCNAPRNLPGDDASLLLPSKYRDPRDGLVKDTLTALRGAYPAQTLAQPWHAQAAHLAITSIVKTDDPVTKDY